MSDTTSPSGVTDHLGYWLRLVSNHVSQSFARKVEASGVTVAEWVMLRDLYEVDAIAPSLLADRLVMTRGAVSKLAERLIAKGLVSRSDNPADARAHALSLTHVGRDLTPRLALLADQNDAAVFGHLPAEDRRALETILKAIVARRRLKDVPVA